MFGRLVDVPIPETLRVRPGDSNILLLGLENYARVVEQEGHFRSAIYELKKQKREKKAWASAEARKSRDRPLRAAVARAEELLAAGERYLAEHEAADRASGVDVATAEVNAAEAARWDAETEAIETPAKTADGLVVKLVMFRRRWSYLERAGDVPTMWEILGNMGRPAQLAISLAIDLALLLERAQLSPPDPGVDTFRPLGELAARIAVDLATAREAADA